MFVTLATTTTSVTLVWPLPQRKLLRELQPGAACGRIAIIVDDERPRVERGLVPRAESAGNRHNGRS